MNDILFFFRIFANVIIIPTLGIKSSHAGNKMFPRWE